MAHIHINDLNQTPTYQICSSNDAYIGGLKDGQTLFHLDPAFMQKDNGLLVGIDQRFQNFYVIDQHNIIIDRLLIEWKDCLSVATKHGIELEPIKDNKLPVFYLSFVLVFSIIIMIKKVVRCKRY